VTCQPVVSLAPEPNRPIYLAVEVIDTWRPKESKFLQDSDMNFFNDNIDYTVASQKDLIRITDSVSSVATKYGWLDAEKSPPVLRSF